MNLPSYPPEFEQEDLCFQKLCDAVPSGLFLLRTLSGRDCGVDRVLECKLDGTKASNFQVHIQCKSNRLASTGELGCSVRIPIYNLNYLLNHPKSIYIAYNVGDDRLTWAWAEELQEYAFSRGIDPATTAQKTLTFNFRRLLDESAFRVTHSVVVDNGKRIRKMLENASHGVDKVMYDRSSGRVFRHFGNSAVVKSSCTITSNLEDLSINREGNLTGIDRSNNNYLEFEGFSGTVRSSSHQASGLKNVNTNSSFP